MNLNRLFINLIFQRFSNNQQPKYVAIYGAGQNGLFLNKFLQGGGVRTDFFCDSNPIKQGNLIDGVPCITLEELNEFKDNIIVFVSPNQSEDIMRDLTELQFPHIISSDILKLVNLIPQTKIDNGFMRFPRIGHFYSLYPDLDQIIEKSEKIFDLNKEVLDISFHEETQLTILRQMVELYSSIPKWVDIGVEDETGAFRHRLGNSSFSTADAVGLHCMLRILKPNRLIEVGSGFTSAITLDTNEFYLDNQLKLTFIEPYPRLLKSVLKKKDNIHIIESGLQDVPLDIFEELEDGDILFIDSTHVSKINSDVNYLFFEILPRLKKGVYIHLHDILYPFEYPKQWIIDGVVWNELYLLRAFLQNNSTYAIVFFQNMMQQKYIDLFMKEWPYDEPVSGSSIWLRKRG